MKRFTLFLLSSALAAPGAWAETGKPDHYTVTVSKVELCAAGSSIDLSGSQTPVCTSPYLVGSGTKVFDLADVGAGQEAGSYFNISASTWPVGTTFTYMRVTLSRAHSITAVIPVAGTTSGSCASGVSNGSDTTLATGTDSAGPASSTLIYEQDPSSPFGGGSLADLYENGQVQLDGQTYTQMIPLTAAYKATTTLPTIRLSFDMQAAVTAETHANCTTISPGSTCCFGTGPVTVHLGFQ